MHKHAYVVAWRSELAVFDKEWGGGSWYWMHGWCCWGRDANRIKGGELGNNHLYPYKCGWPI